MFEGVALITFFSIVIGRAWLGVDVPSALISGKAKLACIPLGFSCYNRDTILRTLSLQVLQFTVVKPLSVIASHQTYNLKSKAITLLFKFMGTAATVTSMFTCISSLLVLEVLHYSHHFISVYLLATFFYILISPKVHFTTKGIL